jgi:hypothetical protein
LIFAACREVEEETNDLRQHRCAKGLPANFTCFIST